MRRNQKPLTSKARKCILYNPIIHSCFISPLTVTGQRFFFYTYLRSADFLPRLFALPSNCALPNPNAVFCFKIPPFFLLLSPIRSGFPQRSLCIHRFFFFSPASDTGCLIRSNSRGYSREPLFFLASMLFVVHYVGYHPTIFSKNLIFLTFPSSKICIYQKFCVPLHSQSSHWGPRRMKNIRWGERRQWSHQPISGVVWFIAIRLSNATRIFALDFKSVLFPVWSNRLWPYIPMSYNRPLRPATTST